jgi:hypothetical protein
MNGKIRIVGLTVLAVLSLGTLASCSSSPNVIPAAVSTLPTEPLAPQVTAPTDAATSSDNVTIMMVDEDGSTSVDQVALVAAITPQPVGELTADEITGLLYMREEEKLAHDVYLTLSGQWGMNIFQNIAGSEATHSEAVLTLINRYGLEDPAAGNGVGVFTDPDLQALYDQLVADGGQSLASALRVGAAIEEIDILDLEKRLAQTDQPDITLVYQNLMAGSRNHLRAFVSVLGQQTGETYQPQYLSQAAFDDIIGTPTERGRGRGRGNNP